MRRCLNVKTQNLLRKPLQTRNLRLRQRPELRTSLRVARKGLRMRQKKGLWKRRDKGSVSATLRR